MNSLLKSIQGFIYRNAPLCCVALAVIIAIISFTRANRPSSLKEQTLSLQQHLQSRQAILEEYAYEVLDMPLNQWPRLKDFPFDMVIYRYDSDTLVSWVNEFPIFSRQLDNVVRGEQFVNIGSKWYVTRLYTKENQKVIAALLVKTEPTVAEATKVPVINPRLGVGKGYDIESISEESTNIIIGREGKVLFSLTEEVKEKRSTFTQLNGAIWIALLLLALSVLIYFFRNRTLSVFILFILSITFLRLLCFGVEKYLGESILFSPRLYADTTLFDSLGDLLLNNAYVTLIFFGIYIIREKFFAIQGKGGRIVVRVLLILFALLLFAYINYTLRSLVNNSSIVLELHRITEINVYTIVCYLSYGLLFLVLMFLFQMMAVAFKLPRRYYIFTISNILIYTVVISLYTLFTISLLSISKEYRWTALVANKLSIDRDLELEMELKEFEEKLKSDVVFENYLDQPSQNINQIQQRFSELYFQRIKQKYAINMTFCTSEDVIQSGGRVENCLNYFGAMMMQNNAIPIADNSSFFYLSNNAGKLGYLGAFYYDTQNGQLNLFIEVTTKFSEESLGYPYRLLDSQMGNFNIATIPSGYSYAKYSDDLLTFSNGEIVYPNQISYFADSDDILVRNGKIHFINNMGDGRVVVVSRNKRVIFPYLVTFSYLVLFFLTIFIVAIRFRLIARKGNVALKREHRGSIRFSLNLFITLLITASLLAAGFGSVWFCLNYYEKVNKMQMEEKVQNVQNSLAQFLDYLRFSSINQTELNRVMDKLASDIHTDINLFDSHGELVTSTKLELFSKYILSGRMRSAVYSQFIVDGQSKVFNKERIGNLKYNSLYSAIYAEDGDLMAIVNVPYFNRNKPLDSEITPIIAAIINIVILLLLLALFFARVLSRRVTEPLVKISNRMKYTDVTNTPSHIEYKGDNELGVLVESYNQMVDSLGESTRQIAQVEREKAWSDMARQIAHEIKNPLTPMKLSIQRLIKLKGNNPQIFEEKFLSISEGLLEQIDILSNTASEFSSYAKFYVEQNTIFNLYDVIKEESVLFDNRENMRISFTSESEKCFVNARRGQIIRVLVNLVNNAIQALDNIEEKGFIKISLSKSEENMYVVSVEDNGNGVDPENLPKLFTPNFTTKTSGNGLGLAISKSIVEQSGGKIWHTKSELGGACFSFSLPRYDGETSEGELIS